MNKDQIQSTANNIDGNVQQKTGTLVANRKKQAKGLDQQISRRVREMLRNAKEGVKQAGQAAHGTLGKA